MATGAAVERTSSGRELHHAEFQCIFAALIQQQLARRIIAKATRCVTVLRSASYCR